MSSLSPRPRAADDYGSSNDHDDPLAELARIVAESSNFEPVRPALRRVEPQVDFEAELINELRASIDVANDHAAPRAAEAPVYPAVDDDDAFERALNAAPPRALPADAPAAAPEAFNRAAPDTARAPAVEVDRYDAPYDAPYDATAYAEPRVDHDPRYAEPRYADDAYGDPRYAEPAYAEEGYDDGYGRDPRYADAGYDEVDAYGRPVDADGRAQISLDDFERDLAATAVQSVEQGRHGERRAEPSFDAYDDFDDYDRLPPVEGDLSAERPQPVADAGGAAFGEAAPDGRLGLKIAAGAMALVVVGGLGFLGYRAFGPTTMASTGGAPPVIKAESQPAKVVPQGATPAKTESDRVAPANQQRIVAKQEEPVDTVGNKQVRVVGPGAQPAEGEEEAPRRVRTVVVRPDGTIVQPNTGAAPALPPVPAPAAPAATTRPAAPAPTPAPAAATPAPNATPPAAVPAAPAVAAVPAPGVAQPQPAPTRPTTQAPAAAAPATPAPAAPAPVVAAPAAPTPAAPAAATPAARPVPPPPATVAANRPAAPAPAPAAPAAPRATPPAASAPLALVPPAGSQAAPPTTVAAVPAPAAAAPAAGGGGFVVQLSSQRSEADARRDFQRFQSRFGGLLAGKSPDIQSADLGNRGVYYRLRVGPGGSREEAVRLCEQIKAQGGDCVVARR